jgi:hypothetical protein
MSSGTVLAWCGHTVLVVLSDSRSILPIGVVDEHWRCVSGRQVVQQHWGCGGMLAVCRGVLLSQRLHERDGGAVHDRLRGVVLLGGL